MNYIGLKNSYVQNKLIVKQYFFIKKHLETVLIIFIKLGLCGNRNKLFFSETSRLLISFKEKKAVIKSLSNSEASDKTVTCFYLASTIYHTYPCPALIMYK